MGRVPLRRNVGLGLTGILVAGSCAAALAQWTPVGSDAENQAVAYSTTAPADAVADLQRRLDEGLTALRYDRHTGYLSAVLHALHVPAASQSLVFSRTSFQRARISPAQPRALYFNRDVYVGWVPGGAMLEIASIDPALGPVFYTLEQREIARPRFERQTRACLQCHDSPSSTRGVPGLLMKSVPTDDAGEPIAAGGTYVTTDRSPASERWGGWYVTDGHRVPHMGLALAAGAITAPYLTGHSDPAALSVLAHQTSVQNLLTHVGYRTRMARHFDRQRNRDLGLSEEYVSDATTRLIATVAEPLVRALLFVDEAPLVHPIAGTSGFAEMFGQQGPRDRRGRSLYEMDLTRRLLRYPCSYLIYSPAFEALPAPAKAYVYRRVWDVLSGRDAGRPFAHLTPADRTAVLEILRDTKQEFTAYAP